MNRLLVALLFFVAVVSATNPISALSKRELQFHTWVVLVCGSKDWGNYRHQSDICHAYQAIHNLGVPEEHIIVMMEDDIAYNLKNPFPGKIFNGEYRSVTSTTPNVYEGVPHDYTHELVTYNVFYDIMTGEEMTVGSNKSLRSGPEDNVFVFYDDHGGSNSLPFPDGTSMNSAMISTIINKMAEKNMFKNLIIYVEACYSGSMFYKLTLPPHVYVTTAAPVGIFSYGGCGAYVGQDYVALCDAYSYSWIHDLETSHPSDYSFSDQFEVILDGLEDLSQGCQYGDKEGTGKLAVEDYFGPSFAAPKNSPSKKLKNLIPTPNIELVLAQRTYERFPSDENKKELDKQTAIRNAIDRMGIAIVSAAKRDVPYLASTPCDTCDMSCQCYKGCIQQGKQTPDYCGFECCNEDSCYDLPGRRSDERDSCVLTLSREYSEACRRQHPYMLSTELLFHRVCRQSGVNITNAIQEIKTQCSSFDISAF